MDKNKKAKQVLNTGKPVATKWFPLNMQGCNCTLVIVPHECRLFWTQSGS